MPNRLANETSPYLLQHAHNPVDWFPWGDEAFEKARAEDKPVLVSIGYAACHWCHVMERESFESEAVARLMNEEFVNIKVDREERPDVDAIYMDAVQAISGSGGWPLNVFLLPDGRPFYGGTYYPPVRAYNRASWTEVLQAVARSYREKSEELEQQAEGLTQHLQASNAIGFAGGEVDQSVFDTAAANALKTADKEWGGFGRAPKFPQSFTLSFLLQYAFYNEAELRGDAFRPKAEGETPALTQVLLSLDKMRQGGIYDHIGGGFARYSTDNEWLAPHFEKMLYDNALLVCTYADAYAFTGNEDYWQVIEETLAFVERELTHADGGFFSALDADSEGEEGKFYVWSKAEVEEALGSEAQVFCDFFDVTEGGNWERKNIPRMKTSLEDFSAAHNLDSEVLAELLADGKQKLLAVRSRRIRPLLDDKVLLNWNALMNAAYSRAYAVTGNERYLTVAERNMRFLLSAFGPFEKLHHGWKDGKARHPSFLDDYAFLIAALLQLSEVSAETGYLQKAAALAEVTLNRFGDEGHPLLFYTAQGQSDILLRKKEVYDGATPSGNSVMAQNLYRLSLLLDRADWRQKAEAMVQAMGDVPAKYPTSFGVWLSLQYEMTMGTAELAVVGEAYREGLGKLLRSYLPHKIAMAARSEDQNYPLLRQRNGDGKTLIFFCRNYVCCQPVITLDEALALVSAK